MLNIGVLVSGGGTNLQKLIDAQAAADAFAAAGEETVFLGEVVEGDEGVVLC